MGTDDGSETGTAGAMAGLDAAIEAARLAYDELPKVSLGTTGDRIITAVRAAYPHIRRAVLNEAADAVDRACHCGSHMDYHCDYWTNWLRERAEEGGDG